MGQTLHHSVVKCRPYLLNSFAFAVGPSTVREQGYRNLELRVDPQRGYRESEVSERCRREMQSSLRRRRRRVPSQCTRGTRWNQFPPGEEGNRFRAQNRNAVQHGMCKQCHVFGGREQTRVASDPVHDAGGLVVDFALDNAAAKAYIVDCWWNQASLFGQRIKPGTRHAQRAENLALAKGVEIFVGQPLS